MRVSGLVIDSLGLNWWPVLRILAEGRVKWAFWPPGYQVRSGDTNQGIWLNSGAVAEDEDEDEEDEESEEESEEEDEAEQGIEDGSETEDNGEEESEEGPMSIGIAAGGGRFGVLALADDGEPDEDEDP
jgi:nucleosome binding factor SPN SPT16 subunit